LSIDLTVSQKWVMANTTLLTLLAWSQISLLPICTNIKSGLKSNSSNFY
jgi:hypothetical protein